MLCKDFKNWPWWPSNFKNLIWIGNFFYFAYQFEAFLYICISFTFSQASKCFLFPNFFSFFNWKSFLLFPSLMFPTQVTNGFERRYLSLSTWQQAWAVFPAGSINPCLVNICLYLVKSIFSNAWFFETLEVSLFWTNNAFNWLIFVCTAGTG